MAGALGHIPAAFHSTLPEPQQIEKYAKVVDQLAEPHALAHVGSTAHKNLKDLEGTNLLPGTLASTHPDALKNTETTRAMATAPAKDAKTAANERGRAIRNFFEPRVRLAKAKWREVSFRTRIKFLSPDVKHTIEVQDMDDNVTSEQLGTNYRQVHNAVAMVAADARHVAEYPVLTLINDTMRMQRENPKKVEGMPWVCNTGTDFEVYGMSQDAIQPKDFRPAFVRNLLDNIHLLNPDIQLDPETKEHVYHLIYNNFNNQYERMIDPTDWSDLDGAEGAPKVARIPARSEAASELPFPHAELELMQGAKNYLEKQYPGEFRALISNRMHPHVRKAMEKSGLMPFFDYVTGTPLVSVYSPADVQDAEKAKSTELDEALQASVERKEADIAELMLQKAIEEDPSAVIRTSADLIATSEYAQTMEATRPAREAEDKELMLRWKQQQHTSVEQIHRKPDQWMTQQAIEVAIEAGYKFSKYVKLKTMGDTGKDGTQIFPTLENDGKLTDNITIAQTEFTMINPYRQAQFNKAMALAKQKGLNVDGKQVSDFSQVKR